MSDTTFTPTPEQWERMIPMHEYAEGKGNIGKIKEGCIFGPLPVTYFCGAAGLASTPKDYLKFARMLEQRGKYENGQIISEQLFEEMITCHAVGQNDSWGYGVRVIREGADPYLPQGSFGWSGAYGTHFWVDPQNEIIGIYFKNSSYDGGSGAMTSRNFERDVYS
jgi:CubicO group peptidase (beta-lactamase class C family)